MSQFDMFSVEPVVAAAPRLVPPAPTYPPAVEIEPPPLVLRVRPQLDDWIRTTQRLYLTNMARRLTVYRAEGDAHRVFATTMNAREVLLKLNGMGGQW